eukprot:jgi/Tetstr1/443575/TSEL_031574.t1
MRVAAATGTVVPASPATGPPTARTGWLVTMAEIAPERYEGVEKSSFGFKLLETMGWSEGQGLGREKQGIKKHITAKKKFDNLGVGTNEADKRNQDWTLQMVGFSSVLKSLSEITSKHSRRHESSSEDDSYASDASIPFTLGKRKGDTAEDADSAVPPGKKGKKGGKGKGKGKAEGEAGAEAEAVSFAHGELGRKGKGKKASGGKKGEKGSVRFAEDAGNKSAPEETVVRRTVSHIGRFKKREAAKCVRSYSSTDLAAILGEKDDPFAACAAAAVGVSAAPPGDQEGGPQSSSGSDSDQSDSGNAQEVVSPDAAEGASADPQRPAGQRRVGLVGQHLLPRRRAGQQGARGEGRRSAASRRRTRRSCTTPRRRARRRASRAWGAAACRRKVAGARFAGKKTKLAGSDDEGGAGEVEAQAQAAGGPGKGAQAKQLQKRALAAAGVASDTKEAAAAELMERNPGSSAFAVQGKLVLLKKGE